MVNIRIFSNSFMSLVKQYCAFKGVSSAGNPINWVHVKNICGVTAAKYIFGQYENEAQFAFELLSCFEGSLRKCGVVIPDKDKSPEEDPYALCNDVYMWLENSVLELSKMYLSESYNGRRAMVDFDKATDTVVSLFKEFLSDAGCSITMTGTDWNELKAFCIPVEYEWVPKESIGTLEYYDTWVMSIFTGHFVCMMYDKGFKCETLVQDVLVPKIREALADCVDWSPLFGANNP